MANLIYLGPVRPYPSAEQPRADYRGVWPRVTSHLNLRWNLRAMANLALLAAGGFSADEIAEDMGTTPAEIEALCARNSIPLNGRK